MDIDLVETVMQELGLSYVEALLWIERNEYNTECFG